jgi:hypothetical protein
MHLGIDMGTSYTKIAALSQGEWLDLGQESIPSVAAYVPATGKLYFGWLALRLDEPSIEKAFFFKLDLKRYPHYYLGPYSLSQVIESFFAFLYHEYIAKQCPELHSLENEGKGEGMAQMFQMMNMARMETGHLAASCIANAMYNARDYAKERIQGRLLTNPKAGRTAIINHEDIRRTLLLGKAHVEAMRAMLYKTYFAFDVREHDPDPEKRKEANLLVEITTPLCKAYPSDEGWWLCAEAIQVYGGYGYCEEYPVAQIARDMKIYSIWEGTNFIQSLDLCGRKMTMGKGVPFQNFMKEMYSFYEANKDNDTLKQEFEVFIKAFKAMNKTLQLMQGYLGKGDFSMMPLYSRRILTALSQLYAGRCILDQAILADKKAKEVGPEHYDYNFYLGKVLSARYYLLNVVPNVWVLTDIVELGDRSALEIPVEAFDY